MTRRVKNARSKTASARPSQAAPPSLTPAELDEAYFAHRRHYAPIYSMDMDPELVETALGDAETTTAARSKEAAKSIAEQVRALDTVRASHRDGEASARERFMSVMAVHRKAAKSIEEMVNNAGRALAEDLTKLRGDFLAELASMNQRPSVTASELRAIAAGRDQEAVENFVRSAIDGEDGFVIEALLSMPPYMINLSAEAHEKLLDDAMQALAPATYGEREVMRAAMRALTHQANAVVSKLALDDRDQMRYEAEAAKDHARAEAQRALDSTGNG